eukprot:gene4817-113_t
MANPPPRSRVDACAAELKDIQKDVAGLKRRLGSMQLYMFKTEMLRARRQIRETMKNTDLPGDALNQMTEEFSRTSLQIKREERMESFKFNGRAKLVAQERLDNLLGGLNKLRFDRWTKERGLTPEGLGDAKKSTPILPSTPAIIPGAAPALPLLGDLNDIPELGFVASSLKSNYEKEKFEQVQLLRKALSKEDSPPIKTVIESGVVPYLSHLLLDNSQRIQFEAAWALTNIASGTSEDTMVIIKNHGISLFTHLLKSPNTDICDQAIWALGNIAGDSPESRDSCIDHGIIPVLINILRITDKANLIRNATWCLSNMCRGKPQPALEKVESAIPMLTKLCHHDDKDTSTDAFWALSYLSDGNNARIDKVLQHLDLNYMVSILRGSGDSRRCPVLRIMGNIVSGNDNQTQACIDAGLLPALKSILQPDLGRNIDKEIFWTLSNITAGMRHQIQAVMDEEFIPIIVSKAVEAEERVAKEAVWAIANITSGGSPEQVAVIATGEVIRVYLRALNFGQNMVNVTLESVHNTLRIMHDFDDGQFQNFLNLLAENNFEDAIADIDNELCEKILEYF